MRESKIWHVLISVIKCALLTKTNQYLVTLFYITNSRDRAFTAIMIEATRIAGIIFAVLSSKMLKLFQQNRLLLIPVAYQSACTAGCNHQNWCDVRTEVLTAVATPLSPQVLWLHRNRLRILPEPLQFLGVEPFDKTSLPSRLAIPRPSWANPSTCNSTCSKTLCFFPSLRHG